MMIIQNWRSVSQIPHLNCIRPIKQLIDNSNIVDQNFALVLGCMFFTSLLQTSSFSQTHRSNMTIYGLQGDDKYLAEKLVIAIQQKMKQHIRIKVSAHVSQIVAWYVLRFGEEWSNLNEN